MMIQGMGAGWVSAAAFRFDLVDLRLFIHVADARSMSRGSERSNLSLAAASTRIKNLELNLNAQLFERGSRGVTLTAQGELLARHARTVLQQLEQLNADFRTSEEAARGKLRLAANISAISSVLPGVIRSYLRTHPDVQIEMRRYLSVDGLRALRDGDVDVALVSLRSAPADLECRTFRSEEYVVATPRGHVLGELDEVTFASTLDFDHIGIGDAGIQHPQYARIARETGKALRYRIHVSGVEEACLLVADGDGIAILPRSATRRFAALPLDFHTLSDRWARRELQVCVQSPRTRPRFVYDFVDMVLEAGAADASP
jgi:DNA-binding transcriptional LysR family regulator